MPPTSASKALFFFYAIEHTARAQGVYQESNGIMEGKSPENFTIFRYDMAQMTRDTDGTKKFFNNFQINNTAR